MMGLTHMNYSNLSTLPSAVRLYSIDCYQRLRLAKVINLEWIHLCSVADSGNAHQTKTGFTEWQAIMDGNVISLSWDWRHHSNYEVSPDFSGGVRTNILCLDERGYDLSVASSEALLSKVIERLDWQHFVMCLH